MDSNLLECPDLFYQLECYVKNYIEEGNWVVAVNCKSEGEKKAIHTWASTHKLAHISVKYHSFKKEYSFKCQKCGYLFKDQQETKENKSCPSCHETFYKTFRQIPNCVLIGKNTPEMKTLKGKKYQKTQSHKKQTSDIPWSPEEDLLLLKKKSPTSILLISIEDLMKLIIIL